jgi:transposase
MRSVDMTEGICFAGLDVHARKTAAAAVQLGSGEVFKAQISGPPVEAIGWLQTLPGPVRAVYEAGPTGYGLARAARAAGLEVMVCAPGAIPRQPGDRIKTDTRDALKLARLLAAGQLRAVRVPEPELEALRDLVRAREDLRGDLMGARHRISKLLLRRGLTFPGPGEPWASQRHLTWLACIDLGEPLAQVVLGEYLACHEVLLARRDRLDALIADHATSGPWAATVARLRCLRGVDTLTAVGLVAEIGDFTAFEHPKQLASFLGLVPSEQSLGNQAPPGRDHQVRLQPCPPAADRSRLALPPPTHDLCRAAPPPRRPATGSDRGRVALPATPLGPLDAPGRPARQAPHDRRGRRRPRTGLLRLGDRPPTQLNTNDIPFEVGVAAGARQPRSAIRL